MNAPSGRNYQTIQSSYARPPAPKGGCGCSKTSTSNAINISAPAHTSVRTNPIPTTLNRAAAKISPPSFISFKPNSVPKVAHSKTFAKFF